MATEDHTIVFVTGANSGVGYETVRALLQSSEPYYVYLGSRSLENGNQAAKTLRDETPGSSSSIEVIEIDVSSDDSINTAFEKLNQGPGRLDVLVNNAGHSLENRVSTGQYTLREAWNKMYDVNVTGAHILTSTLAPLLCQSSNPRLLFLSSGLAQLETLSKGYYPGQPPPAGWPKPASISPHGYRASKTGLNMMMLTWFWTLKNDGVKVWSVNPGWLATNLGGTREKLKALGAGDPALGGTLIKQVIEGERDADVGKVVLSQGIQPF